MGATPARPITTVIRVYDNQTRVMIEGYEYEQSLASLTRVELVRVAAAVGAARDEGTRWGEYTNEELIARINGARFDSPLSMPTPDAPPTARVSTDDAPRPVVPRIADQPRPVVAPVLAEDDSTAVTNLANALADLMARPTTTTAPIDEDLVLSLVDDAVSAAEQRIMNELVRPVIHRIEIAGKEAIDIGGYKHAQFVDMIRLVGAGCHTYLVGPPGTGKTTLAHQAATALQLTFASISLGPTTPASQVWGYCDANGTYHATEFRKAYEFGGVYLFDEIDNGHPGIIATVNQALANDLAAFPDGMVKRHDDFVCIAAANTYGTGATAAFVGRNQLDAATLDRFEMLEIPIDEDLETKLAHAQCSNTAMVDELLATIRKYRVNIEKHGLKVILSPRAAINGAKMINAGFSMADIERMRLLRNVSDDQRRKIQGGY